MLAVLLVLVIVHPLEEYVGIFVFPFSILCGLILANAAFKLAWSASFLACSCDITVTVNCSYNCSTLSYY